MVQVINETVRDREQSENIDRVNGFLIRSFGYRWRGNYDITDGGEFETIDRLHFIGKKSFPFIQWKDFRAGKFLRGRDSTPGKIELVDGSIICVFPKYYEKARRYAELYQVEVGKEVKIIVANNATLYDSGLAEAVKSDDEFLRELE